jgi:acyl transferase domain-containing protein
VSWPEVVATAAVHRSHFACRAALQVQDAAGASEALGALAEGRAHAEVTRGQAGAGSLAVMFSGQGSQRLGMGQQLYGRAGFEAFSEALDEAIRACDAHREGSLRSVMWPSEPSEQAASMLQGTGNAQPALFALEVALFRQWQAWGLRPEVVLGHSVGEIAAAHVAGVLTLEDAGALVSARGRLMEQLATGGGQMASVAASEEETQAALGELLQAQGSQLSIACVNGPMQTVIV